MDEMIFDSSVLVKLFSKDEKGNTSEALLSRLISQSLSAVFPEIAIYELVNVLKLSKKAPIELIYTILTSLLKTKPRIIPFSEEIIKKGVETMEDTSLTIYDAVFVAAAETEKIPLLTADYKHHKKEISRYIVYYKEWNKRQLP